MGIKVETVWLKHEMISIYYVKGWKEGRKVLEDYEDFDGKIIPEGFVFDGASVPRVFWRIIPPFKNLERSARHDLDCLKARDYMAEAKSWEERGDIKLAKQWKDIAIRLRKKADQRFRDRTHNWIEKHLGYAGVRAGSLIGSGW